MVQGVRIQEVGIKGVAIRVGIKGVAVKRDKTKRVRVKRVGDKGVAVKRVTILFAGRAEMELNRRNDKL